MDTLLALPKALVNLATSLDDLNNISIYHPTFKDWARDMEYVYLRINAAMHNELDDVYDEINSFVYSFNADLNEAALAVCADRGYKGILRDTIVHYSRFDLE